MLLMFLAWKVFRRTKFVGAMEIDLITDRFDLHLDADSSEEHNHLYGDGDAELDSAEQAASRRWKARLLASSRDEKGVAGQLKRFGMWLFL